MEALPPCRFYAYDAKGLFCFVQDVDELFAEADGVALGDVDDTVEGVGDDEDGEGAVGQFHVG